MAWERIRALGGYEFASQADRTLPAATGTYATDPTRPGIDDLVTGAEAMVEAVAALSDAWVAQTGLVPSIAGTNIAVTAGVCGLGGCLYELTTASTVAMAGTQAGTYHIYAAAAGLGARIAAPASPSVILCTVAWSGTALSDLTDTRASYQYQTGTAPVTSVHGRTGAVVAVAGDYGSDDVTNDSAVTGATVSDALETLTAAISASGVPTTRTIATTAPLTGGGDLSADRTLAVSTASTSATGVVQLAADGGTTAGTAVQASDSRLSNARTPTTHASTHAIGGSDALSAMTGASSSAAGAAGLVPAPAAGDQAKVLSGAGTWVAQSSGSSGAKSVSFACPPTSVAFTVTVASSSTYGYDLENGAFVLTGSFWTLIQGTANNWGCRHFWCMSASPGTLTFPLTYTS